MTQGHILFFSAFGAGWGRGGSDVTQYYISMYCQTSRDRLNSRIKTKAAGTVRREGTGPSKIGNDWRGERYKERQAKKWRVLGENILKAYREKINIAKQVAPVSIRNGTVMMSTGSATKSDRSKTHSRIKTTGQDLPDGRILTLS